MILATIGKGWMMPMKWRWIALAAVLAAMAPVNALALTIAYDFDGGPNGQTLEFTQSDVLLTVTAENETGGVATVSHNGNGLGVAGNPESGRLALDERLTFDFGTEVVRVLSVEIFESGSQPEEVRVQGGGATVDLQLLGTGMNPLAFDLTSEGIVTSRIDFIGLVPNGGGNRGVRIASIEVEVVPLPGSLTLALGAVGALVLVARRRGTPACQ